MSTDGTLARSLETAIEGAARKEWRFWGFTLLWVLGSAAILWFLWKWNKELDVLASELAAVEGETVTIKNSALASKAEYDQLGRELRDTTARTETDLAAARNELTRMQADAAADRREFGRTVEQLESRYAQAIQQADIATRNAQRRYEELYDDFGALRQAIDQTSTEQFAELNEARRLVSLMTERVANVERQLKVSHFELKTRSRNLVYGMDIYIGFGHYNNQQVGLDDFCLAVSEEGDCFFSKDLVRMGEEVAVTHNGFAYTITPRYAVRMLLAHDHIGFDILREAVPR